MTKQYVNLPTRAAKHYGSRVTVEVDSANLGPGKIGLTYWIVEDAPGATNTDKKYLAALERARPQRTRSRSNKKKKFRNTLLLPHTGGDKYKVKCSKKKDLSAPKDVEEFETWRKIFYTVHWMNQKCLDTFNAVKGRIEAAFGSAFIEMEQVTKKKTLVDELRTYGADVALTHLYKKNPPLQSKPFHLRIVVLNDIYDIEEHIHTGAGIVDKVTRFNTKKPLSDISPHHFLIRARAWVEPSGPRYNIRPMVTKLGDKRIEVDLTRHRKLSRALDKGKKIHFQVSTRERSHFCGYNIGNFCCVRINEVGTAAKVESTILQTFTHEVGHGLQQAVKEEETYDATGNWTATEQNPEWHNDNSSNAGELFNLNAQVGQGPHCRVHADPVYDPVTNFVVDYKPKGADKLCTMFYRDHPDVEPDGKFCADQCVPRLKRVSLNKKHMQDKFWNDY